MKITCACGALIPDQTDYLPFKAHLVADRDWEDFVESAAGKDIDTSYVRLCYQCVQCGRLYVEDAKRELHGFVPEKGNAQVLGSCQGVAWRSPLVGAWSDRPLEGQPRGYLWCEAEGGASLNFEDWVELERAYFELFQRLRNLDRLRSSFLRRGGNVIHSWPPEA